MSLIIRIEIHPATASARAGVKIQGRRILACSPYTGEVHGVVPDDGTSEIVENRSVVLQTDRPSVRCILSTQFDVIRLVVDRFGEFGNIERAGACAEESPKRPAANVMILPKARGKGPSRLRRVADLEPRYAVIKTKIYGLRVGVR